MQRRAKGWGLRAKAVCFDLDGVLVNTMPLHARAWQEVCRARGLQVPKREIYAWEGESGAVTARTLLRRRRRPVTSAAVAGLLCDKETRFTALARHVRVEPYLARLLSRLAKRGIRLSLVTGTSAGEVRRIVSPRILSMFGVVVTGDCVRHGKPHPEPYRTAMRRLGIRPRDAIVVENAPYGIRSARRAGAGLVIAIASSLPKRFLQEAHLVLGSAASLDAALEPLVGRV